MVHGFWAVAAAAFLVASPALASDTPSAPAQPDAPAPVDASIDIAQMTAGYTYFNRPGADLKLHDADVADCAAEGARTISLDEQLHTGASGGLVGALLGSAIQAAYHRGAAASGLENCMVVRGWRVVRLPDDEGKALAALPPADLTQRLAPWVGADQPHGQIVRAWANEAADARNTRYSTRPAHSNDGQLSLTEATSSNLRQFAIPARPADSARDVMDPKWPKKPLTVATLASAPPGSAIIMVQIKDLGLQNGIGVWFNRIGDDGNFAPSRADHAPDRLVAMKGILFAHRQGDMFAFAVPPGRWRLYGMGMMPVLNFCLGSPSFPVAAGEVVYAGSFDLGANDLGPDLDLTPAKAWLGAAPQAAALRAAVYTNGSRGECGDNTIYAIEVKGAPFAPDYAWGGALKPLPPLPAQAVAAAAPPPAAATPPTPAPAPAASAP